MTGRATCPAAKQAKAAAPSPVAFQGKGEPLPAPEREFFEPRLDYDFGSVRVHHGSEATASALSLKARAYTYGRDIVFGAGEYSPRTPGGRGLLAHELAHVVQQSSGHTLVQRTPLSDKVKDDFKAHPTFESLLARLSEADVQGDQSDGDVDKEIANILATRPDDLWVAQRIRKGELGKTTGALGPQPAGKPVPRPIQAFFFKGSTDRRALVIAGVHGTERQGMEVAQRLISDLKTATQPPAFTTIIVPSLFPDNAARGKMGTRESETKPQTPTNRNFPPPSEDLAAATAAGGGTAVDASKSGGKRTRAILPENLMLMELMERFHPERIISIHGTSGPGSAGVFYDRRSLRPDEVQAARVWAKGNAYMQIPPDQQDEPGGQERLAALEERLFRGRLAQLSGQAEDTDRDLSLAAANKIDAATTGITGRERRSMIRETEQDEARLKQLKGKATKTKDEENEEKAEEAKPKITPENQKNRSAHPSIAGNVGPKGAIDNATWSGSVPGGVSLGSYAPPRGMSVFTVEPPLNLNSADYSTAQEKVSQADRMIELQAYADAVRTVLLGAP
jgi:Domain of unknown function (DUF4157)